MDQACPLRLATWLRDTEAHQAKLKGKRWREARSQMDPLKRKRCGAGHG